ncbi:recQ-mediated genome instability protein 1 isoform X2 [Parambassis ranga]|uniref:RecQ-mediated genome instability protein 1 n=1 Tax=Parambassis ranga TaxID=210632 RepID=A0A6P7J072_9TELE|nr:recQ-mediated genome instability protein 1 isoform X2 [Parambassis ranga]
MLWVKVLLFLLYGHKAKVLDQWLLTDLRDLDFAVLPEGLAQAQKTELSGNFCVQVDSLLDISQPAYGQLQKWRGTDCSNEEVSAVTQATQRPWEARPNRMLLLQVSDGVQSLEAMEYQSIPALGTALRPGAKLLLQGKMVCRLGVLLLGPTNIKILGGEVEDLVDRNNQGRVLCRTLGLPEEEQEEGQPAQQPGIQEVEHLELNDTELLAGLEAQEVVPQIGHVDSGYGTLSETSTQSSRRSPVRSLASTASSRTENSTNYYRSGLIQSSRSGSVQGHHNEQEDSDYTDFLQSDVVNQEIQDHSMADEDFPDDNFDDLPLDELDSVIFQENQNVTPQSGTGNTPHTNNIVNRSSNSLDRATKESLGDSGSQLGLSKSRSTTQKRDYQGCVREASGQSTTGTSKPVLSEATAGLEPPHEANIVTNDENNFMDEMMDSFFDEAEQTGRMGGEGYQPPLQPGPSKDRESSTFKTETSGSSTVPAVTLSSPPFTYLCLLEELMSKPKFHTTEIHVKAFIVTLLGKLSSNNGVWRVCATISDGTGYLDVELSNEVLTNLLGFSVAEKGILKRDPTRRGELDAGMRRCQEGLVDMCCIMTIVIEAEGRKAVVTKADPVNDKVLQELEQRVSARKK